MYLLQRYAEIELPNPKRRNVDRFVEDEDVEIQFKKTLFSKKERLVMSIAKHILEDKDALRGTAKNILKQVQAYKTCPYHEFDYASDAAKLRDAYKLANTLITKGELPYKRRELTDAVKEVFDEVVADECNDCAKEEAD